MQQRMCIDVTNRGYNYIFNNTIIIHYKFACANIKLALDYYALCPNAKGLVFLSMMALSPKLGYKFLFPTKYSLLLLALNAECF